MEQPKDFEVRRKTSRELCNEIHHDLIMLRIAAGAMFVLGFILGALMF